MKSPAEILLAKHLKELHQSFEQEVRFHPVRLWRWDYTLPEHRIAIEIDGGIWLGKRGGHSGGFGLQRDMDKRNHGTMLGWRVLVFSTKDVLTGRAKDFLKEHLA